jgi:hypothetical protein
MFARVSFILSVASVRRTRLCRFLPLALDDAGLELLAPRVERLDPLRHRVAHGQRGVDRIDHRRGGDPGEDRAGEDDVDTEKVGPDAGVIMTFRFPAQISKLTILAMMNTPMLIHTSPRGRRRSGGLR